ncbi:MAG: hypothetical protein M3R43_08855 [Acidobacteriota bacterium]|nr:hypothetical protein [Acidobacteriota bacterium]
MQTQKQDEMDKDKKSESTQQDASKKVQHAQPGGQTDGATGEKPAGGGPWLSQKK